MPSSPYQGESSRPQASSSSEVMGATQAESDSDSVWDTSEDESLNGSEHGDREAATKREIKDRELRGGRSPRSTDVFIAVMGDAASGKSSFISLCSDQAARINHGLEPLAQMVSVYAYDVSSTRTVYLVETPCFDSTDRGDGETLREITRWLNDSFRTNILLHGIIYLHRIIDRRFSYRGKKNLLMFTKLCGQEAFKNMVFVTTMWDRASHDEAEARERQLIELPDFWGNMIARGSTVQRHYNTAASARAVVAHILEKDCKPVILDVQNEMVNRRQTLAETAAGREIEAEISREKRKLRQVMKEIREETREAIRLQDEQGRQELRMIRKDYTQRMSLLNREREQLRNDTDAQREDNQHQKDSDQQMSDAIGVAKQELEEALRTMKEDYTKRVMRMKEDQERLLDDTEKLHTNRIAILTERLQLERTMHAREFEELQSLRSRRQTPPPDYSVSSPLLVENRGPFQGEATTSSQVTQDKQA